MDTSEPVITGQRQHESAARRRSPKKAQIGVIAAAALLAAAALVLGPTLYQMVVSRPAHAEAGAIAETDSFKPTSQESTNPSIAQIDERPFRGTHQADGQIAIDDDLTTTVFSPYSGRVTRLFAKAGDEVAQGAPLFAIASTELVQAQNDLILAAAMLRTAQTQLKLAQTNEGRQHDLYIAQGGALKDWQQSQADLASAQGGFASAQIAVAAVRNRLHILGKSSAEVRAIEATPELLSIHPDSVVTAPLAGTVITRQVGLGQNIVSPTNDGSTPVFRIGNLSKVWLVANARETDAPLMHVGDQVEVRVPGFPSRVFGAKLTYVGASIDPNTHRLPVRAEVDNPDRALKPQMLASFTIITIADSVGSTAPDDAVVYKGGAARVWVARADRMLGLRSIKTGLSADGTVAALVGLKAGESLVTSGSVLIDRAAKGD